MLCYAACIGITLSCVTSPAPHSQNYSSPHLPKTSKLTNNLLEVLNPSVLLFYYFDVKGSPQRTPQIKLTTTILLKYC